MRQYWRDENSLFQWTRSDTHRQWWQSFLKDSGGTGFWHETYFRRGGIETVYGDVPENIGLMAFAPRILGRIRLSPRPQYSVPLNGSLLLPPAPQFNPLPTQFRPDRGRSEHWHSASSPDGEVSDHATRILYIESSSSTILTLPYPRCQTRYFQHNKTLSDLPAPEPVNARHSSQLGRAQFLPELRSLATGTVGTHGIWPCPTSWASTEAQR